MSLVASALTQESIWFDKFKFGDAEQQYYERLQKLQWIESCSEAVESPPPPPPTASKSKASGNKPVKEEQETKASTKDQEAKASTKDQEAKASTKDQEAKASTKDHETKASTKDHETKASTKDHETKPSSKDHGKKQAKEVAAENPVAEKTDAEKEQDSVKKPSKKSKKNKKKNQQLAESKSEGQTTASTPKGSNVGEGKKGQQTKDDTTKDLSQGNIKKSESKKGEKKEAKKDNHCSSAGKSILLDEIARARQQIKNSLNPDGLTGTIGMDIITRLQKLEEENSHLKKVYEELKTLSSSLVCLSSRVEKLEKKCTDCPSGTKCESTPTECATAKPVEKKEEEELDLFGSDEEDDPEKEKIKAERLKMYEEKKSKKPAVVAKSNIVLDVKPWGDETDMKAMENKVREIACDGLLWGASKLVPQAYGIYKLQISCVIEDDLVSVDWLQEQIEANEDLVQSVDIAAFNKV